MDFFLSLKSKVNNAVDVILNSPVIRNKFSQSSVEVSDILKLSDSDNSKSEDIMSQRTTEDDNSEFIKDQLKSPEEAETLSDSDESEDQEHSDNDSVFDAASTFHRFYHPGLTINQNRDTSIENKMPKKLSRQISVPENNSNLSYFNKNAIKYENKVSHTYSSPLKSEHSSSSNLYYVSPRRDSLFDTVQLKSSMNLHLKYGDHKERLTFTVSKNSTAIDLKQEEKRNSIEEEENLPLTDGKERKFDRLGSIGIELLDEDGETDAVEIDITDIEADKEENSLKNARRQSISDRLSQRRSSDIMAEIIRLSAENRRKEFKKILEEHDRLVRSIDHIGHNSSQCSKRELFTLDSMEASSEDGAIERQNSDSSNGVFDNSANTTAESRNGEKSNIFDVDNNTSAFLD